MITIEYYHNDNIYDIYYHGFKQKVRLDTVLSIPSYPIEEEGTDNANGVFTPDFQRWEKRYHFDCVVPEYMLDALMSMMTHDNVFVEDIKVTDVDVSFKWEGYFAKVDVEFTASKVIKSNCCENMQLGMHTSPLPGGQCYEPNLNPIDDIVSYTNAKYTDPLNNGVSQGVRLLVYTETDVYNASFRGSIFEYTIVGWELQDQSQSDGVFYGDESINLYFDGNWWRKYPWIWMVDQAGVDTYHVTGYAVPETWVYVSYNDGTWHQLGAIWAGDFNTNGATFNVTEGDYTWKIDNETFSCSYVASNDIYKESGFWLINDGGDYFTQNAAGDKWYR